MKILTLTLTLDILTLIPLGFVKPLTNTNYCVKKSVPKIQSLINLSKIVKFKTQEIMVSFWPKKVITTTLSNLINTCDVRCVRTNIRSWEWTIKISIKINAGMAKESDDDNDGETFWRHLIPWLWCNVALLFIFLTLLFTKNEMKLHDKVY